jgi:UDP-glucose 4-epimerase
MRCLVTGGCGFIGGHIVDKLLNLGHDVTVVDDESAGKYKTSGAKYWRIDIRNYDALDYVFARGSFDCVFHLAAESRVGACIDNPVKACDVNFTGVCNVLQLSREYKVKRFILSSTSAAYGLQPSPHHELLTPDCLNPYSVTKIASEKLLEMYFSLYDLETITFRYFNVYGERSPSSGQYAPVVSLFLKQKETGPMTITGDGSQRRDFVHVSDVVEANLLAATKDLDSEVFGRPLNIGSGENHSVLEIAQMIGGEYEFIPARPGEAKETLAVTSAAKKFLGWEPKVNFKKWLRNQK